MHAGGRIPERSTCIVIHDFLDIHSASCVVRSSKGNGELRNNSLIKSRYKDGNVIHSVAYSEHSSFDELVQFVSIFR